MKTLLPLALLVPAALRVAARYPAQPSRMHEALQASGNPVFPR